MKRYFDIHCHTMTSDHVPLKAAMRRLEDDLYSHIPFLKLFAPLTPVLPLILGSNKTMDLISRYRRYLSAIDIREDAMFAPFFVNAEKIRETLWEKRCIEDEELCDVIFTPLMMPFRDGTFDEYQKKPSEGLMDKIEQYEAFAPNTTQSEAIVREIHAKKEMMKEKRCYIFPFAGVDISYFASRVSDTSSARQLIVQEILPYIVPEEFRTSVESIHSHYCKTSGNDLFIGVKLYPPIENGFIDDSNQLSRKHEIFLTELLTICSEQRIPVTTHAGESGFRLSLDKRKRGTDNGRASHFRNPLNAILQSEAHRLRLNFAHLGGEKSFKKYIKRASLKSASWTRDIVELLQKKTGTSSLYTDISYLCGAFPKLAAEEILSLPIHSQKILWGTDWTVVLSQKKTYQELLSTFLDEFEEVHSYSFRESFADMAENNPERFLFK